MLERERERVAEAGRRLAAAGLVLGSAGNISECTVLERGCGTTQEMDAP